MAYEYYRQACKRLDVPFNRYDLWRKTAKALKLSSKAGQRLTWFIFYRTKAKHNASLTIRHFGLNRSVFYYWKARFNEANLRSLEDQSTAPASRRQKEITPLEEERAIALRKTHIHWGKMKLERLYQETYRKKLSSWQFQRTIQTYRLYPRPVKNARIQAKRQKAVKKKRITELKFKLT